MSSIRVNPFVSLLLIINTCKVAQLYPSRDNHFHIFSKIGNFLLLEYTQFI